MPTRRRAFTLIELLVVISIIGVLVALLLPAVQAAREAARRARCSNNLKQVGLAMHAYHGNHNILPSGYVYQKGYGTGGFGWASMILPHIEQAPLFASINFDLPAWSSVNSTACVTRLDFYQCPMDTTVTAGYLEREGLRYAHSSYVACFGPADMDLSPEDDQGLFSRNSRIRFADATDGLSQTLAGGERTNAVYLAVIGSANHFDLETVWPGAVKELPVDDHGHTTMFQSRYLINNPNFDDRNSMSYHSSGSNYLFADGSVKFLKLSIDLGVYQALGTRRGGEVLSADSY